MGQGRPLGHDAALTAGKTSMELRKTYVTRLGPEDYRAVVVRDGAGRVWVETEGGERISDALVLDGGRTVSIRRGGRMYLVDITPRGSGWKSALVNGQGGKVQVLDELAAAAAEQMAASGGGHPELKADMPGLVVEVKCATGDRVERGQPLIILEAMKMQNELPSPGDGVVEEIFFAPGSAVESGAVLLRIAPDKNDIG
jgi:biotin carboxyl carrier protein